jgi:hypothetical protein
LTGQAQSQVNNFKIDVKVTQGIEDAGYLVHVFDRNQSQRRFLDRITVTDKRTSFSTHVDEPLVGDLTAIFPDGTVCTACVRFPFVPGEQVQVKVKNGTFELSGSTFYQQWADADELEENAHKYYKQWETDSIILNYLKKHADEEGCVMRYWQYEILPRTTILSIIPESMKNGRFKYFFAQYQPEPGDDVAVTSQSSQTATTYSAPSQSSSFPGIEPSPLLKMQLEQKAMSIKSDMDAIKALYTSLGPFYEAKIFYGTDDIFASITRQNKALDKKCQDIIKTLKDMHAPQADEARMLNDFYKEIVKFFTEQNKGYVELNRELGDLPKAAKKAQKYINQLAGKYLVEMSKVH